MESCTCINCTGDNFHLEQMTEEITDKDSYMENKPPSLYEKLEEVYTNMNDTEKSKLISDLMDMVNAVDNELIALALELPTEQAEKLLAIQEALY